MTSIVLIEHNGTIKQVKSKDISRETLYKKCGFKTSENFDKTATWSVEFNKEIVTIELWSKYEGKPNNENKYDFPPPVDNELYFGTCVLIRIDGNGKIINLTSELWLSVYDKLFGGFENTSIEDDEIEEIEHVKTKNGYINADDAEDDDDEDEDDEDGEDDEEGDDDDEQENDAVFEPSVKKKDVVIESEDEEDYGSELEEETYSYSDDTD